MEKLSITITRDENGKVAIDAPEVNPFDFVATVEIAKMIFIDFHSNEGGKK